MILVGIAIQNLFVNYSVVYFFYATNLNYSILTIVRFLLHFYPPFLFSKSYLDISRLATYHFDSSSFNWVAGSYFGLNDIFSHREGKLRIGVIYYVESLFETFCWFYILICLFSILIFLIELKENFKIDDYYNINKKLNKMKKLLNDRYKQRSNIYNYPIIGFFFKYMKIINESMLDIKKINVKKQLMENSINKTYDKFLKEIEKNESQENGEQSITTKKRILLLFIKIINLLTSKKRI